MLKSQELADPNSCLNRAGDDEPLFVLLGRDVATRATIEFWIERRLELGKNNSQDPQIQKALGLAKAAYAYFFARQARRGNTTAANAAAALRVVESLRKGPLPAASGIQTHEGNKYLRRVYSPGTDLSVLVDVYEVLEAFAVTCPARQHAIKKLLMAGRRGKGDCLADLVGAKAAIDRAIELEEGRRAKPQKEKEAPATASVDGVA